MKFRKKPVIIDAIQFDGTNFEEVAEFMGKNINSLSVIVTAKYIGNTPVKDRHILISTLEGTAVAVVGDWIIRGTQGEYYPCKPHIFDEIYEEVKE